MTTPTRLSSTLASASLLAFTAAAAAQTVAQTVAREVVTEMLPKRGDADPPEPESTGIVERVLDLQGISELSLEQLMDLPVVTASGKAYQVLDVTLRSGGLALLDRELDTRFSVSVRNALSNDYIEPGFSGVDIPQPDTSFLFQVQQEL